MAAAAARVPCLSYLLALSRDNLARPNENRPTGDEGLHTTNDPCIVPRHNTMFFLFFFLPHFDFSSFIPSACPSSTACSRPLPAVFRRPSTDFYRSRGSTSESTSAETVYKHRHGRGRTVYNPTGYSGDFPNGLNIIHAIRVADKAVRLFRASHPAGRPADVGDAFAPDGIPSEIDFTPAAQNKKRIRRADWPLLAATQIENRSNIIIYIQVQMCLW